MESDARIKAFESIYSLRKYKSLAFKFEKKNIRKKSINVNMLRKNVKALKISSPDI